jgi:hypothetical protein
MHESDPPDRRRQRSLWPLTLLLYSTERNACLVSLVLFSTCICFIGRWCVKALCNHINALCGKPSFPFMIRYTTRTTVSCERWSLSLPEATVRCFRPHSELPPDSRAIIARISRRFSFLTQGCNLEGWLFLDHQCFCASLLLFEWSMWLASTGYLQMIHVVCRDDRLARSSKTAETRLRDPGVSPELSFLRGSRGNKYDHNLLSCARQDD